MFKLALLIVLYTKQIDLSEINDLNGINQNVRKPKILNRDESTENFSKETFDEEVIKNISAFLKEFKQPCILLVDEYKHENTLIQNLLEENNEFRLMKFNDTGITSILIKLKNEISQQLKLNKTNIGSVACFGILQTVRILPAGGTILVFIDRKTQHENLANLAVKELLENHIKLFVIWEGSDSTTTNGDILLEQAAVLSGGLFFARKLNNQKVTSYRTIREKEYVTKSEFRDNSRRMMRNI